MDLDVVYDTLQAYLFLARANAIGGGTTGQVNVQADSGYRVIAPPTSASSRSATPRGTWSRWSTLTTIREMTGPALVYALQPVPLRSRSTAIQKPGILVGAGHRPDGTAWRARNCPRRMGFRVDRAVLSSSIEAGKDSADQAPSSRWRWCSCSWCWPAQYESWSLPMVILLIVPMCLLSGHHRRLDRQPGQQHLRADWPRGRPLRHPDRRALRA